MTEPLQIHRREPDPNPPFTRVAIVGLGLIGGSVALAARRQWPTVLLIAVDRKDVIERATVAHTIDVGADDIGMIADADLIVLAAPVSENERLLADEIPEIVTREVTITDVGSAKRHIAAAARRLPQRLAFVGGHPMAGAVSPGFEHAHADLFTGKPWILCAEPGEALTRVRRFASGLGANPVEMSAEEHDRVVAFVSHLPQLAISALMDVVGTNTGAERLGLAGPGLSDSTRLAGSPPEMWKDISRANADQIRGALDALIDALRKLRDDADRGEVLERVFRSAQEWKSHLRS